MTDEIENGQKLIEASRKGDLSQVTEVLQHRTAQVVIAATQQTVVLPR